jgi:hypothetical protein
MTDISGNHTCRSVWADHEKYSEVANRLKKGITRSRLLALCLGIFGAILATFASGDGGTAETAGANNSGREVSKLMGIASAVSLTLATFVARGFGKIAIQNWTRARSVSEKLKQEVYLYLTGTKPYNGDDRVKILADNSAALRRQVEDLAPVAARVSATAKPLPDVATPEAYISNRVNEQITGYYEPNAKKLSRKLRVCQTAATVLTLAAAALSAFTGFLNERSIGAWVAVVTTVTGAILAFAAAARYDQNIITYASTARQLAELRDRFLDTSASVGSAPVYDELVRGVESVISIENQAWMSEWNKPSPDGS